MNLRELGLVRELSQWEIKRVERIFLEEDYREFTGDIDICELHIPYTKYDYLNEMFKNAKNRKGKQMLVLAGDILNLDMISFFYKRNPTESLPSEELEALIKILNSASKIYDHVVYLATNHEARIQKVILNNFQDKGVAKEVLKFTRSLTDIFKDEGLNNIDYLHSPFIQIGDVVVCHFENNSIVAGKICRDVIQYLMPRLNKSWNVAFQAHTHSQAKIAIERKVVIEIGATCETMDYWRDGKMKGRGKMSSIGYGQCEMKKGKANVNMCNFVLCGWEGYL